MHPARRPLAALALVAAVALPHRVAAQDEPSRRPAWEVSVHGVALMNAFYNDNKVNNSDLPLTASPADPPGSLPMQSLGAAVRQTRIIGMADLAGFAGGMLHTELDLDFFGGQLGNGRTSPLLRIRRVIGEMQWRRTNLLIGEEAPLVSDVNPVSLATLGFPGYSGAGNLWLWIPQIRASYDLTDGEGIRWGVQGALLAPSTEEPQTTYFTSPNRAERSGRPMVEGRVRARWGETGEIGVGGHAAWFATAGDSLLLSRGVMVSGVVPLGRVFELRGEWFTGTGLADLGGGGIGQGLDGDGAPLQSTGGWAQLNAMAGPHWEVGVSYGQDDPDGTAADEANTAFRDKNASYAARVQWRLTPAVVAFEYRHLATTWGGGIGERTATHLNLAMGVEF